MKPKEVRILVINNSEASTTYIHHYSKNRLETNPGKVGFMCGACGVVYPDKDTATKCCNK